jgi:lysozyme family protein
VADRLTLGKSRYQAVSKLTGVPWEVIAVIHEREASGRWDTYLGNGQLLSKKTTVVPKGRGPFATWEEGAVDALVNAPPKTANNKDWTIGSTLTALEKYNGLGYADMGVPSPYIWAGTDQYVKGKYIADHKYDPNHVDEQLGCAGLLKFLGYNKSGNGIVAATVATAGAATTAAAAPQSVWDHIAHHWLAYGFGTAIILSLVGLMIYAYNHKDEVNVSINR